VTEVTAGTRTVPTIAELRALLAGRRAAGASVALVPTMGALHDGHLALVRRARELADVVVVSIFVNPLQFGPGEDLERYPRTFESDVAVLAGLGVDVVFAPAVDEALRSVSLQVLRTPPRAPQANAYCERLIGTIRRECLDWMIPLNERHLRVILAE